MKDENKDAIKQREKFKFKDFQKEDVQTRIRKKKELAKKER